MTFVPLVLTMCLLQNPTDSVGERLFIEAHLQRFRGGNHSSITRRAERINAIRKLGFGGTRLDIEWSAVERKRGQPDWALIDSIVQELKDAHLSAYALLTYSPHWAVPAGMPERHRPFVDGSTAKGDTAFAHFAASAARRYGRFIRRWEVWNEENNPIFWINITSGMNRGPDARDYVNLFSVTYDSLVSVDQHFEIAIGGLASFSGRSRNMEDPVRPDHSLLADAGHVYLRQLLSTGFRPSNISLHP